jgi:FixJ family two-component response regulator
MVMPDLNGLELQWELARLRPSLPLIFITAHAREPAVRQAMIAGAVAVLRKPVAESVLLNTLRAALGHGEVQAKL